MIKRSKTKLEEEIPIPNISLFQSPYQLELVDLVRHLSLNLTQNVESMDQTKFKKIRTLNPTLFSQIRNVKNPQRVIDICFFNLFDLAEEDIDRLGEKFYMTL